MSFKREGDDSSWLNKLKNRRVAELFSEDIPEDEAYLMKNGRFCCMVCHHRPIFDTVSMLAVHRQGKKHAASSSRLAEDKLSLEVEKMKRQQQHYVKKGSIDGNMGYHTSVQPTNSFLKGDGYNPRVKKTRNKPYDRKTMLDLSRETNGPPETEATPLEDLPGSGLQGYKKPCLVNPLDVSESRPVPKTIDEYRKLKKIGQKSDTIEVRPYIKKDNNYFQNYARSVSSFHLDSTKEPQKGPLMCNGKNQFTDTKGTSLSSPNSEGTSGHGNQMARERVEKSSQSKPVYVHHVPKVKSAKSKPEATVMYGPTVNEEKLQQQQRYLQAVGSGWVKDRAGNW